MRKSRRSELRGRRRNYEILEGIVRITLSLIKADIGGYVGHSESHPEVLADAHEHLAKAKANGLLIDYYVTKCGDDLELIMTHQRGVEDRKIHKLAWDTLVAGTKVAKG
jgi:fructose 1,6-bisphosphate aldolase/phosphatase